jgi:two-component system response regulator PilR (NtrC family)
MKGSFTGAIRDTWGKVHAADGGTLFLDEIGELPLEIQPKLLRLLQEREYERLGENKVREANVRVIAATNRDLAARVRSGDFREDLYYRLNVIELRMPALRERPGDIPSLADALLGRLARRAGLPSAPRLASVALRYLSSYSYPGNVRELENILERALAFSSGGLITVEDLGLRPAFETLPENELAAREDDEVPPTEPGEPGPLASDSGDEADGSAVSEDGIPLSLPRYLEWREREAIVRALERTAQNRTAAARLLGISFRALRHRMQRLNMQ